MSFIPGVLHLLLRLAINAAAIYAAARWVDGVHLDTSNWLGVAVVAAIFGLVNAFLKPIAKFLGFPFIVLTLGLFSLVINAALFLLTARLTSALSVNNFRAAFWGAIVTSLVGWLLSAFFGPEKEKTQQQ